MLELRTELINQARQLGLVQDTLKGRDDFANRELARSCWGAARKCISLARQEEGQYGCKRRVGLEDAVKWWVGGGRVSKKTIGGGAGRPKSYDTFNTWWQVDDAGSGDWRA